MNLTAKIISYEFKNILRSKWLLVYFLFFFMLSYFLYTFGGDGKALISLMNIIVIIIPLISIMFGTMYMYSSREFIETILCQPIDRKKLFAGVYIGTVLPLAASFAAGILIPYLIWGGAAAETATILMLLVTGIMFTVIFSAAAFVIALKNEDKVKGLGLSLLTWLMLSILYDGIILLFIYMFQDYPVENGVLALSILNPVDLGRILFMLEFDFAALMGYTGALFQKFFEGGTGILISAGSLTVWSAGLIYLGLRIFIKKDF